MVRCFVECCKSHTGNTSIHFFRLHKTCSRNIVKKWKQNLSTKYRKFDENDRSVRVCEKHFLPEYILKNYNYVVEGKEVVLPRGRLALAEDAVPTLFLNIPDYLNKSKDNMPKRSPTILAKSAKTTDLDLRTDQEHNDFNNKTPISIEHAEIAQQTKIKEEILEMRDSRNVVPGYSLSMLEAEWNDEDSSSSEWVFKILKEEGNLVGYFLSLLSDRKAIIGKQIRIFQTLEFQVFFADTDVTTFFATENQLMLQSTSDVRQLLNNVSCRTLCVGLDGFSAVKACGSGHKVNGKWFSRSCDVLGMCKVCIPCKKLYLVLMSKTNRKTRLWTIPKSN